MENANVKALAAAAAMALAASGCGGSGGGAAGRTAAGAGASGAAAAARDADRAPAVDLDPDVSGGELLRLQRYGAGIGTSDLAKWGRDGSAVTIQAYGGGGEKIRRCRLRSGELARLRAAMRALPLRQPDQQGSSAPSAQYVLTAGHRVQTFTEAALPAGARPLTRLLAGTLDGRAARCRTTYRTRR